VLNLQLTATGIGPTIQNTITVIRAVGVTCKEQITEVTAGVVVDKSSRTIGV